jgi:branched-chain amino acid transport system permease protein
MLHWTKSGELRVMVILGGAGTLLGPLFGAFALLTLETVLSGWTERWQFFLGPILILIILYFRGGLSGLFKFIGGGGK